VPDTNAGSKKAGSVIKIHFVLHSFKIGAKEFFKDKALYRKLKGRSY